MKSIGCNLEKVAWAMVTHFHMDHAGLISAFIERGITCLVFDRQMEAIDAMEKTILKNDKTYKRINKGRLVPVSLKDSRQAFGRYGINGQVVATDYHSPDSISFVTDQGEAVIGDLPPLGQMMPGDTRFERTWDVLKGLGVKRAFPSHAGVIELG